MERFTAIQLLGLVDRGKMLVPFERAVLLLEATYPEETGSIERWGVGKRDAHLLKLRETFFGSQVNGIMHCPACNLQLELRFAIETIRAPYMEEGPSTIRIADDGGDYLVTLHSPNTLDLREMASHPNRQRLLSLCIDCVSREKHGTEGMEVPAWVMEQAARALAEIDPQGSIRLETQCVGCGHDWVIPFDVLGFLWSEIEAWAKRTIQEVHRLAWAYGWTETEILELPAWRREQYLALVV